MCMSVSSVGFVQYSQSRGRGLSACSSTWALEGGGRGGPDATLYTEDTPRRERKKKKSVPSSRVCGFEVFLACLSFQY